MSFVTGCQGDEKNLSLDRRSKLEGRSYLTSYSPVINDDFVSKNDLNGIEFAAIGFSGLGFLRDASATESFRSSELMFSH